jgi:hypothetical protein
MHRRPRRPARAGPVSPLASWLPGPRAERGFRRRAAGRRPVLLPPRDAAWRAVTPGFAGCVAMARSGLPFHVVADRRVDRAAEPRRLARALAAGHTVYLPQVHQVLPRLMRLIVALRAAVFRPPSGTVRAEASFLFVVEGTGRPGLGLHHDGDVDAVWLQLEGYRTVTLGPRVAPGTPEELDDGRLVGALPAGWRTLDLGPGSLLYLPARTPHRVLCRGRSLAVTLTWARPRRRAPGDAAGGLLAWDVVSGFAEPLPRAHRDTLWTQVPVQLRRAARSPRLHAVTADGTGPALPPRAAAWAGRLLAMPRWPRQHALGAGLAPLLEAGILGPHDLPLRIRPDDPAALDGWRFA